ncbi:carboxy terminal-processing peptidase [Gramella sp. AN32]|uniref:Carboxy terminal-processing peptidase n=1 Tax=Christiangramia antarctica TaxID=2058158 RepID=A0ABW5X2Z2_9FLAO|nr:carboxy terminal-processing peptidase [Gramella sp. AN32]MCM4156653.1 tail-specific protease [Gramella sp. AN32]
MKRNIKLIAVLLLMAAASCSFTTKSENDPNKDKLLIDLITYVLNQGHYDAKDINDQFSANVYEDYLDNIDASKRFLYASDVEKLNQYKNQLDDEIKAKNIDFFNLSYEMLNKRMIEAKGYYSEILAEPFDFTIDEEINADYEHLNYVTSKEEMKKRWEDQLKFSTLITYYDLKEDEKAKKEDDAAYEMKADAELEKQARKSTMESFDRFYGMIDDLNRDDYFTLYINSIVEEYDPHSYYFAPQQKDAFDIRMSGKLEGIGARLVKDKDNITINEVLSGGPAWRSEQLEEGDVILKVQQEDEEEAVSIVGMRLGDAVELIKGPKDSKVILTVRKKLRGNIEEITLVRDIIELEETYAKTSMVEKDGQKFGVINLPAFYFDTEDYESKNAATDIENDIKELKKSGMEGLVLDLRNNGGGSLQTVVDLAGLFIKTGPVVQVKSNGVEQEVLKDDNPEVVWDGPLVILVNELSASASEILAAAMQDYKRAVIIGSEQTYGKGTVQNLVDLNRWLRNNDLGDMGALKITRQKFYRVNGGSVQLEGVKSDIVMPDRYAYVEIGEKDQDNPLPWDKIESAKYDYWENYKANEEAIANSKNRLSNNAELLIIDKQAKWIKTQSDENTHTLNYEKYVAEAEKNKNIAKEFEVLKDYNSNLTFNSLPFEEKLFVTDTTLKEKRDRWHENLSKDLYVEEALNVLSDIKTNSMAGSKLADAKKAERIKN